MKFRLAIVLGGALFISSHSFAQYYPNEGSGYYGPNLLDEVMPVPKEELLEIQPGDLIYNRLYDEIGKVVLVRKLTEAEKQIDKRLDDPYKSTIQEQVLRETAYPGRVDPELVDVKQSELAIGYLPLDSNRRGSIIPRRLVSKRVDSEDKKCLADGKKCVGDTVYDSNRHLIGKAEWLFERGEVAYRATKYPEDLFVSVELEVKFAQPDLECVKEICVGKTIYDETWGNVAVVQVIFDEEFIAYDDPRHPGELLTSLRKKARKEISNPPNCEKKVCTQDTIVDRSRNLKLGVVTHLFDKDWVSYEVDSGKTYVSKRKSLSKAVRP